MANRLTALIVTTLILFFATPCVIGADSTAFKYPESKVQDDNLSFYQPALNTAPYPMVAGKRVKNVILCIGDGMGAGQITLARLKAVGSHGKLHMERMPVLGTIRTHSANKLVTDSAAGGTALACGVKTKNGMIGMTPDGLRYATILEAAQAMGMATGLVATSTMTHATPAAFASHVPSRDMEAKIAEQMIARRVNVLFAGGRKFFLPKSDPDSARKDDTNLIAEAMRSGYMYAQTAEDLRKIRHPYVLGLFNVEPLTTEEPEPSLAMLTTKAINLLKRAGAASSPRRNGFFLMVEGSQIDWACHDNDSDRSIRQTLLFDEAVRAAIDFAVKDGQTLVIVTADHETGGLTIPSGNLAGTEAKAEWSTKGHSAMPVPVYALGPQAALFAGVYENTEIARKMAYVLGITPFPMAIE